jgi:hypothetical protein
MSTLIVRLTENVQTDFNKTSKTKKKNVMKIHSAVLSTCGRNGKANSGILQLLIVNHKISQLLNYPAQQQAQFYPDSYKK